VTDRRLAARLSQVVARGSRYSTFPEDLDAFSDACKKPEGQGAMADAGHPSAMRRAGGIRSSVVWARRFAADGKTVVLDREETSSRSRCGSRSGRRPWTRRRASAWTTRTTTSPSYPRPFSATNTRLDLYRSEEEAGTYLTKGHADVAGHPARRTPRVSAGHKQLAAVPTC